MSLLAIKKRKALFGIAFGLVVIFVLGLVALYQNGKSGALRTAELICSKVLSHVDNDRVDLIVGLPNTQFPLVDLVVISQPKEKGLSGYGSSTKITDTETGENIVDGAIPVEVHAQEYFFIVTMTKALVGDGFTIKPKARPKSINVVLTMTLAPSSDREYDERRDKVVLRTTIPWPSK